MKVLVVGSGGREHAIVWKLSQSERVGKIYCAPGNPGIGQHAECVPLATDDIEGLKSYALQEGIDLTIVGPELPLTLGLVDTFKGAGLRAFGPSRMAAEIEGSKSFSKVLMEKYGIPTARYRTFTDPEAAKAYAETEKLPLVVKANGLAAGKGVIICNTLEDVKGAIDMIMKERAFGEAGRKILIEEFLTGQEASFIAITDGSAVLPLSPSQDHKQVYDGDEGPNTGGMGAYSPVPLITSELQGAIMSDIMLLTVKALKREGRPYKGVLYAGLMITEDGPKVLEFNCRFGDPEAQPILMRMKSDLLDIMLASIDGTLSDTSVEWDPGSAVCVVMTSEGYPGSYRKGQVISGLDAVSRLDGVFVFHAGTALKGGAFVTAGGRVLCVSGLGADIREAIERTYKAVEMITWDGVHYRHDIGAKAVR